MSYSFEYKFWNQQAFPGFTQKINSLYNDSMSYASSLLEKRNVEECTQALERYYVALIKLGLIDKTNYNNVLSKLKTVSKIRTLKGDNSRIYGLTIDNDIYISPNIPSKKAFNSAEMKQLIISHELTHILNKSWVDDIERFSNSLMQHPNIKNLLKTLKLDKKNYVKMGLEMIDEIIAEETSEEVTYRLSGKSRPPKTRLNDKSYIGNRTYYSNLMFYGEFQDIVIKFVRQLSFLKCGEKTSDEEVIKSLIRKSFATSFLISLGEAITRDPSKLENYIIMLACMGKIKDGAYTVMGLSASGEKNVSRYYDIFNYSIEENKKIDDIKRKRRLV